METLLRTDRRLVAQVLRGRNDRFEPLVKRYLPAVRGIAYMRLGNMTDAEDAAQDAFVTAYEKLGDLREPERFGPWLMTIARRAAGRISDRRGQDLPLESEAIDRLPADVADLSQREMWALVRSHLAALPETAREVLVLHYFAGYTTREIAALLDISQAAVLKRLQRGREQLGTSLVAALAGDRAGDKELAKRAARIATVSTAAGVYGGTSTGTAAAAASGLPPLVKGTAAIGVAAVLTAGATFFALSVPPNSGQSAERPSGDATVASAPVTLEPEALQEPIVVAQAKGEDAEPGVEEAEEPVQSDETTETEQVEDSPAPLSLSGLWNLRVGDEGSGLFADYGTVTVEQNGSQVEAVLMDGQGGELFHAVGTLVGDQLSLEFGEEGAVYAPHGEVAADGNRVVLRAVAPEPVADFPSGVIRFVLERAEERVADRTLLEAAFRDEVQAMFDALQAWRAEHGGVYPDEATLRELLEAVVSDGGVERQVKYERVPSDLAYPRDLPRPSELRNDGTFYPALPLPDRLVLLEEALGTRWNGGVVKLLDAVLDVRYPDEEFRFHATESRGVFEIPWDEDEELPLAEHGALRASCANNMKQLGLASIMFQNEVSSYFPPGFNVLYPEFVANPEILRCPTQHGDTISYALLFPAYSRDYLLAIEADFLGVDPEDVPPGTWGHGGIPFMVETHDCAGRAGAGLRHVLFLDGHVETLKPEDYAARIEPYLEYR